MLLVSPLRYLTLRLSHVDFGAFNLRSLSRGQQAIVIEIFKRFISSDTPEEPTVESLDAIYQKYMEETLKFKYPKRLLNATYNSLSFLEIIISLYSFRSNGTIQIAPEFTSRHSHYCRLLFSTVLVGAEAAGEDWVAPDNDRLNTILEEVPSAVNLIQPSKAKKVLKDLEPTSDTDPVQEFEDLTDEELIKSMFEVVDEVTAAVSSVITSKARDMDGQEGSSENEDGHDDVGNDCDRDDAPQDRALQQRQMTQILTHDGRSTSKARMSALVGVSEMDTAIVTADQSESFLDSEFGEDRHQVPTAEEKGDENTDTRSPFEV